MNSLVGRHRKGIGDREAKGEWTTTQVAQAHYRNVDMTLACKQCCVTNGYLQLGLYGM